MTRDQRGCTSVHQVKDKTNEHQRKQQGADVRADFIPGTEPVLPDSLVRKPHRSTAEPVARRKPFQCARGAIVRDTPSRGGLDSRRSGDLGSDPRDVVGIIFSDF